MHRRTHTHRGSTISGNWNWRLEEQEVETCLPHQPKTYMYIYMFCFAVFPFFFKWTFLQIRRKWRVECNVCSAEGAKSRNKHYQTWKRQDNDQKQFCHCQWMIYDGINKAGKEQQRAGNKLCCVLQPGSGRQIEERNCRNFPVMPPIFQTHDWHTCFHSVMPL